MIYASNFSSKLQVMPYSRSLQITYFLLVFIPYAASIKFNFPDIGQEIQNLVIVTEGYASISNNGIQVTPDRTSLDQKAGRATYIKPFHLWDRTSNKLASFSTNFTFVIDSHGATTYADGLTFFLAENNSVISPGGCMGLPVDTKTFDATNSFVAVEFDTFPNSWDPVDDDGNSIGDHVGISINSLKSVSYQKRYSNIPGGEVCHAWITYDSISTTLTVSFAGSLEDNLSMQVGPVFKVDLRTVLPEWVIFGFSATTEGTFLQTNNVKSWSFSGSDLQDIPPPSILSQSPSPQDADRIKTMQNPLHEFKHHKFWSLVRRPKDKLVIRTQLAELLDEDIPILFPPTMSPSYYEGTPPPIMSPSYYGDIPPPIMSPRLLWGYTTPNYYGDIPPADIPPRIMSPGSAAHNKSKVGLVVGLILGAVAFLAVVTFVLWRRNKKKSRKDEDEGVGMDIEMKSRKKEDDGVGMDIEMNSRKEEDEGVRMDIEMKSRKKEDDGVGMDIEMKSIKDEDAEAGIEVEMDNEFEMGAGPKRFSYQELARSTGDFSEKEKLGEGGFGGVFRGFLKDTNTYIAVKRVSKDSKQGIKEYASEVTIISQLRHRNLVRLNGWCHEKGDLLLVYEYMENGSLDLHLYKGISLLAWDTRYKIARGLASAVLYLHEDWEQCVLHRDIKSSNVMLDSNFNAKLGDFGLAKLVDHEKGSHTTMVAGTLGYMAPECLVTGKATRESDVFSFGVVALEIACGKKPMDYKPRENHIRLVELVWELYETGTLLDAADPRLGSDYDEEDIKRLMIVGLWCVNPDPVVRPSMRQVILVLNSEASLPKLPLKMPVPSYGSSPTSSSYDSTSIIENQSSRSTSYTGHSGKQKTSSTFF